MTEHGGRRGRTHDAEGAREAILNAAESVFAEHGFDGARVEAIAAKAGYNKSLIFQYFGDKLNLYVEVTRRADLETSELQKLLFAPLLADETIATDRQAFQALLETIIGTLFDHLVTHPQLMRIILWEQAEGWQTYKKIFSQLANDDLMLYDKLFHTAWQAGLLRSQISPLVQFTLALQYCISYMSWIPMYETMFPGEEFSSAEALARARAYIIRFLVTGILVDPGHEEQNRPVRQDQD